MPTASPTASVAHSTTSRNRRKYRRRDLLVAALGLVVIVGVAVAFLTSDRFNWKEVSEAIARLNAPLVIALMAILPVVGFPISVVYLILGARFGPLTGLPLVTGVTAVHLLAAYWIARSFLRGPLQRFLARRGYHLPRIHPGEQAAICLLAVLVPGLPYFARNYLLALTEVRLRTYFWVCLPVYVIRSYVALALGDLSTDPDKSQLAVIVAIYLIKLAICAYVVWRLRRHRQTEKKNATLA